MANNTQTGTLEGRLQVLEDKESIREVIARYAFDADLDRIDNFLALWTEDSTFRVDADVFKGKAGIKAHLLDTMPRDLANRSQHVLVGFIINVDGDTATAAGYGLTIQRWLGGYGLFRCTLRTFRFRRVKKSWLIQEAISQSIGDAECQNLIPTAW